MHERLLKAFCKMFRMLYILVGLAATLALTPLVSQAADDVLVDPSLKLTVGHFSSGGMGSNDVNLRNSSAAGNLWLGYYASRQRGESQLRGGWDHAFEVDGMRISPSVQAASMGFASFSVQAEAGESWFVGAGFGRTNLRPYSNLNFDPNDSWMISMGKRSAAGEVYYLQQVRDNRLNPDQQHIHAYYREPLSEGQRITLDLLYKKGRVADTLIHKWGMSVTYDWHRFFIGFAYDPKVNFTADNMFRTSIGLHF